MMRRLEKEMKKEDRKKPKETKKRPREEENPKEEITKRPRRGRGDINIIPRDILVSIFLKLPSRSVAAVRMVCRPWHSLTSPSSFVLQHAQRAQTSIIIQPQSSPNYPFDFYHFDHSKFFKQVVVRKNLTCPRTVQNYVETPSAELDLLASCNGLVCFRRISGNEYIVCNLLTKDWVAVHDSHVFLAAFYFHRSTGEYRLLQYCRTDGVVIGMEVISIGGPNDKRHALPYCHSPDYLRSRVQISIRGSVHWPPHPTHSWMLAFDTESEKFRKMSLSQLHKADAMYDLVEMEGSLGLCQRSTNSEDQMDVWFLKDYAKEEWIKRYSISLSSISSSLYRRRKLNLCTPLAVWNGGKELLLKFYDDHCRFNCFVLYDLESKAWKKQKICKLDRNLRNWVPYAESLVSCNSLKK